MSQSAYYSWSMVAMLCNSVVTVIVMNTHPRTKLLAVNHEKINSWVYFSFLYEYRALHKIIVLSTLVALE